MFLLFIIFEKITSIYVINYCCARFRNSTRLQNCWYVIEKDGLHISFQIRINFVVKWMGIQVDHNLDWLFLVLVLLKYFFRYFSNILPLLEGSPFWVVIRIFLEFLQIILIEKASISSLLILRSGSNLKIK